MMPSNRLILCCPLLILPSVFPRIRVLFNESALCIRWPKYWGFSFSISPYNEYSGLISFRIDLLAIQGTGLTGLISLQSKGLQHPVLQHHSSKASTLRHSALFTVQLLHPYITSGKTIALTRWIFVDKVMSLLLNMLSMLVITSFQEVSVFPFHGCNHHLQ